MRILFQLASPGYLRMYGSTLRELAQRGHRVLLSYDDAGKRRDPAVAQVEATENVEVVPALPAGVRRGEQIVGDLRAAADYLRYLDPRFEEAPYLRRRLDKYLPPVLQPLTRARYGAPFARQALRAVLALERAVPSDGGVQRALAAHAPDVVLVTPLIGRSERNRRQTDTVKAARAAGVPVAFGVASWDHLTTKGVLKAVPDATFVWNDVQARDAVELHGVPPASVVVTGAQLFDAWFGREPSTSREELGSRVGLEADRYVVYVGSSPNIAPPEQEVEFVRRWVAALRRAGGELERLGVLVRPHPYNVEAWARAELPDARVAVAPRTRPQLPMTDEDDALYFDSIHHAAAVVGINTSAMVESFIQRKQVLTIRDAAFHETQEGTVHFRELRETAGDALHVARDLDEHVERLRAVVADPGGAKEAIEQFLLRFVRPHGLDVPATPVLADAIERLADGRR